MSSSKHSTIRRLRAGSSEERISVRGMVRRLVVKAARTTGIWQLVGYVAGARAEPEPFDDVEAFQGIGFSSRPATSGSPECIVVNVGAQDGHPIIIATRDATLKVTLEDDETIIYNSTGACVRIRKDGTVTIDDGSGAVALATKQDIDDLKSWASTHVHATAGTGTPSPPTIGPPVAAGTSVLKGK